MDFDTPYLTKQIITYIGNKRKLLSLIYKAIRSSGADIKKGAAFLDLFAGSGVVSRFAKSLGFEVFSNDWEEYSFVINSAFVGTDKSEIAALFGSEEQFLRLLDEINSLPLPDESEQYMAKYYAPEEFDVDAADFKTERLFYTRDNALAIDKIRNFIENRFPKNDAKSQKQRAVLLSLLIYEASTHTNTSGVFKSFHKGFGGHSRDALKRILCPIRLSPPCLIDSALPAHIFREDANALVKRLPRVEIAYLDPPYNQHQYGSNYHILNTIAKWDKIPAPLELNEKGVLKEKAAIRKDWILTKSPYCYKTTAAESFAELLENIDAHYILVSYSTDGIIPFDEMKRLCMKKGAVSIVTNEYTTFRGGKQSITKEVSNIEFILAIDTEKKSTAKSDAVIESVLFRKKLFLMFKKHYSPKKLTDNACLIKSGKIRIPLRQKAIELSIKDVTQIFMSSAVLKMSQGKQQRLFSLLEKCAFSSAEEELDEILLLLSEKSAIKLLPSEKVRLTKTVPFLLKKLAQKKTKILFENRLSAVRNLESKNAELYALISPKIDDIAALARVRFSS